MTSPIGPGSANPYGIGSGNSYGASALQKYGIGVTGSSVTASGTSALGAGRTVYMGMKSTKPTPPKGPYAPGYTPSTSPYTGTRDELDYSTASNLPAVWAKSDPNKLKELVNKGIMYRIPGWSADMGLPEIMAQWGDIVDSSIAISKGTGTDWSPWDVIESYADSQKGKFGTKREGDWVIDVATGERIKYVGKTKKTTTNKQFNLSSAEDVKVLTTQMLTEALGRRPTADELSTFRSSINSMEQANPEIVSTTTEYKPVAGGERGMELEEVGSTSTRSGGLSEAAKQLAIEESVRETPEYSKYQSGTTYFNALMQMISGGF